MTQKEKEKMKRFLDEEVDRYKAYSTMDGFFEKPCNRKAALMAQNVAFALATILHDLKVISFEECCQYWSMVGITNEEDEECCFAKCDANLNGVCKYTILESDR